MWSSTHRKWLHQRRRVQPIGSDIDWHSRAGKPNCNAATPSRFAACHYCVRSICGTQDRPWCEPCLLATAACLLPPAAAACCTCCSRLLCETQTRGRSGLEAILVRVLSNQSLAGLVALWSTKPPRFTRGKNPSWFSNQWVRWVGGRPRLLYALAFRFLILINFQPRLNPSLHLLWRMQGQCWPPPTCRSQPSPTMNLRCACNRFCDPPRPCLHLNFHMYASANSLPCSRVPAFASATHLSPVSKWIRIIIHPSANPHPCSRRLGRAASWGASAPQPPRATGVGPEFAHVFLTIFLLFCGRTHTVYVVGKDFESIEHKLIWFTTKSYVISFHVLSNCPDMLLNGHSTHT